MIVLEDVCKHYRTGGVTVRALDNVSLGVRAGEFVVLRGPSGSGKTTLLLIASGMLRPSSGRVEIMERELYTLGQRDRTLFRAAHIGFVFQMYYLIPYLDITENVMLAAHGDGHEAASVRARAGSLLEELGLRDRLRHRPGELSAGEKQRVAVARALLNQPELILADEPTGNLDVDNTEQINAQLARYSASGGTVLMVTHGSSADACADRVIQLSQGRIAAEPDT